MKEPETAWPPPWPDVRDQRVLQAIAKVPRHMFVPIQYRDLAYADHPLPIGYGQTISQPYVVALMSQTLRLQGTEKVLEIGTGSGYQAAVLAALAHEVYTVEVVPELAKRAALRLQALGYDNVHVRQGDGARGWPEKAPFDAIIVTAAAPELPQALLHQLADRGRMVIPVGEPGDDQFLWLIYRDKDDYKHIELSAVRFVPMIARSEEEREENAAEEDEG